MLSKNILFFFSVTRIGGAETTFIEIIKHYKSRGHICFAIAIQDLGNLNDFLTILDVPLLILNIKNINFLRTLYLYRNFIKTNKINIVFNFGLKVELFSRLFSKFFGANYIVSNIRSTDPWRRWYHTALDKLTLRNTNVWVANSFAGSESFIKREGVPKNKIKVIYNVSENSIIKIQKNGIQNKITIGILSNIKKGKGFEDLGLILKKLNDLDINTTLLIGGVDLLNGEIFNFYNQIGISHKINYMGFIKDKRSFFESIDVFVLPSYWEGLPTSILEALKYGIPVVATNVGGIPEIMSGDLENLLFFPGEVDQAVEKIQSLQDLDYYNMMIDKGSEVIATKFQNDQLLEEWNKILRYD
ncbi:glycosyltransferase family 4 protein [Flavobacterium sp.]|uniref:glycosyltransferase family 4 protein n=1 Tax=Flavobacterium sp. TaxID=239 RepID=UPI0040474A0A